MLYGTLLAGLLAAAVSAHGGVGKYTWDGKDYIGYQPYNGGNQQTIQRQYSSFDPIMNPSGNNYRCNNNGQTSQLTAEIAAGTKITATWTQWTHAEGPVTVWMARCPGKCANFDASGQVWFKIDEAGLLSGTLGKGEWGNTVVLKTLKWTSTIPKDLEPGEYLIRHEVLALHQANAPQFYPECAQLTVTGSGTARPPSAYLVSLPGAIKMSDPGVMVDIYSTAAQTQTTYIVPGPPVWAGGDAPTNPVPSNPPQQPSPSPSPQPSPSPSPSLPPVSKWGQCGGNGYSGSTVCADGSRCVKVNDYYSQCQ